MKTIEIKAKTVEDAITEASLKLGVTSDKMEYEVLEEGSAGFFGIGKRDAVILAHKKEEKIKEKKEEVKEKAKKPVKSAKKEVKNKKKDFKKDTKKEAKKEVKREVKSEEEPVQQAVPKKQKEITPMNEATIKVCEEYLLSILKEMGLDAKVTSREEEDISRQDLWRRSVRFPCRRSLGI